MARERRSRAKRFVPAALAGAFAAAALAQNPQTPDATQPSTPPAKAQPSTPTRPGDSVVPSDQPPPTSSSTTPSREEGFGAGTNPNQPAQTQPQQPQASPDTGASQAGGAGAGASATGGLGGDVGASTAPRADTAGAGGQASSVPLASQGSTVLNAPDLGELLSKSPAAGGVEVQRRNAVSSDPRVRGQRTGQVVTLGDGAFFFPARQDLDTAVAKFDPGSVRDIVIFKGPYTSLLGSGFTFLDIATLDSPRYENGFEAHGRTSVGYQTNGERWDGLQSVFAGSSNWGFRATTNLLTGNDYTAGDGIPIAGSYSSTNVNFALGMDLTPCTKLEFKGVRVHQGTLEFPGLYFDIRHLDTEGYSLKYTSEAGYIFQRFTAEVWYNTTVADGDTQQGAKQAFVQKLLAVSFATPGLPDFAFSDQSTTRFSNRSLGYRVAGLWGDKDKKDPNLTIGTDFSSLGQNLVENIRFTQLAGVPLNDPPPVPPVYTQNQTIPEPTLTNPGLFFEYAAPVNERFKVRAGGRIDYAHTTSGPRLITGNVDIFGRPGTPGLPVDRFVVDPAVYSTDPGRTNLDRDFWLPAVFAGGEYKLDEYLTAIASAAYAERAPTLTELYASGPFIGVLQQGTSRLIGDPSLAKERLKQFDVGLKADYGWLKGAATGFYAFFDDFITFDQNRGGAGITQVVYTNTDRATLAGGELYVQADVTCWLTPFANAAYVQGVDRTHTDNRRPQGIASSRRTNLVAGERADASEPLPQIPPLEIRSGFRVHAPTKTPRWQIEFSARSVFGQDSVATSLNELPTPGFTVFDIRSYWKVTDSFLLTAGVENFGDKLYREHLDPISGNILGVDPLFRTGTNFYFTGQYTY